MLHNQPESSQELLRRNNTDLVDVMGGHTDASVPAPTPARNYRVSRAKPTGRITNMRTLDARLKQAQAVDPAAVKLAGFPFASLFRGAAKAAPAAAPGLAKAVAPAAAPAVKAVAPAVVKSVRRPTIMHPVEQRVPQARPPVPPDVLARWPGLTPQDHHMSMLSREFDARSQAAHAARQAPAPAYVPDMGIRATPAVDPARLPVPKPAPMQQKGAGMPLGANFGTKMLIGAPLAAGGAIGAYGLGRAAFTQSPEAYRRSVNDPVNAAQADAARAYRTQTSDALDLADLRRTSVADAAKRPAPLQGATTPDREALGLLPVNPVAAPAAPPRRVAVGSGPTFGAAPKLPEMYTPPTAPKPPAPVESPKQVAAPRLTAPDAVATTAKSTPGGAGTGATGSDVAGVASPAQAAAAAGAVGRGAQAPSGTAAGGFVAGRAANRGGGDAGGALSKLLPNLSPGMQNAVMAGGAGLGLVALYKLLSARRAERSREDDAPQAALPAPGYGMMPTGYPGYGMPQQPRTIILQ